MSVQTPHRLGGTTMLLTAIVLGPLIPQAVDAQGLTYSRGQSIAAAYEGWSENADGTISLIFGYLNRNWEEELDIPVGPENHFSPGPMDRGQPTHFLPRRNRFKFTISVPGDWDEELVWTLTAGGETTQAHVSLSADYFIDNLVIMSENGSIGAGFTDSSLRDNQPPVAVLEGASHRRVRVGEPLTLAVQVSDDGIPDRRLTRTSAVHNDEGELNLRAAIARQPNTQVPGKVNGLFHSWFVYRGAGEVTFNPLQVSVWEDTRPYSNSPWSLGFYFPDIPEDDRWVTEVTFHEPGTYMLRGRTDDGGLFVDTDVTVEVIP